MTPNPMPYFKFPDPELVKAWTNIRAGETRLGEQIALAGADWQETLDAGRTPVALIGIPEDIGVRANFGAGGADTAWEPFLKAFLNVQDSDILPGDRMLLLGHFDFSSFGRTPDVEVLRQQVAQIDEAVAPMVQAVIREGILPVIIGGGHNNAYPNIKGAAAALGTAINVVNLDAHSDYRIAEGRHSGNGFRYAHLENCMDRYAVTGLHRNYNSQSVINELKQHKNIHFSWSESVLVKHTDTFGQLLDQAFAFVKSKPCGIELDLDCLEGVLSSAATPSGWPVAAARQYLHRAVTELDAVYVHICEGAAQLSDGRSFPGIGKLLGYLVADAASGYLNRFGGQIKS